MTKIGCLLVLTVTAHVLLLKLILIFKKQQKGDFLKAEEGSWAFLSCLCLSRGTVNLNLSRNLFCNTKGL